jgi:hypothetical protein
MLTRPLVTSGKSGTTSTILRWTLILFLSIPGIMIFSEFRELIGWTWSLLEMRYPGDIPAVEMAVALHLWIILPVLFAASLIGLFLKKSWGWSCGIIYVIFFLALLITRLARIYFSAWALPLPEEFTGPENPFLEFELVVLTFIICIILSFTRGVMRDVKVNAIALASALLASVLLYLDYRILELYKYIL